MSGLNSRKGRKPKPTALRLAEGNPGHRKIPEGEPMPEKGAPDKPVFLNLDHDDPIIRHAFQIWDEYAPQLAKLGILTQLDGAMFAAWCCAYAEFQMSPGTYPAARMQQFRSLSSCFGLEPTSRPKLATGAPKTEDRVNPFKAIA